MRVPEIHFIQGQDVGYEGAETEVWTQIVSAFTEECGGTLCVSLVRRPSDDASQFTNCAFVEFDPAETQPYFTDDIIYVVVGAPCPPSDDSSGATTQGGDDAGQDNGGQDAGQDNGGQDIGGQDAGQGGSSPASPS